MEQIKRELELATLPEMPKRLDYRIGIIGAGFIVRNCHLEAYRKAGFNPVAITSLDLEQSKEVAALHKIEKVYPDWKQLVDDKDIEIIGASACTAGYCRVYLQTCGRPHQRHFMPEADCNVYQGSKTDRASGR